MGRFLARKSIYFLEIILYIIVSTIITVQLNKFINSYLEEALISVLLILFYIYCTYYFLNIVTTKYYIKKEDVVISTFLGLKKVRIPIKNITAYNHFQGKIQGMKVAGFGRASYAIGRHVIDKIGLTMMFVPNSKEVIYIQTDDINYGIAPIKSEKFMSILEGKGIKKAEFDIKPIKNRKLYRDKKLLIPLTLNAILICYIILNPFIMYLKGTVPISMPLVFDANLKAVVMGTGKNFVFKQMSYGVFNMIILFCMYYATYFDSKYDKKSSYKYIYISLSVAIVYLLFQNYVLKLYI